MPKNRNSSKKSRKNKPGSPKGLSQNSKGEPYIFFDQWLTRNNAIELLQNKSDVKTLRKLITGVLHEQPNLSMSELKGEILIEFNLENLRFCFLNNFCAEQISTFMSIINYVFTVSLSKKFTASDSFEKLEEILDRHTKQVPPYAIQIFDQNGKEKILEHARGIYKFFLMYEISLTKFVDYNIFTIEPFTEFPEIKPLTEGELIPQNEILQNEILLSYISVKEEEEDELNDAGGGEGEDEEDHFPEEEQVMSLDEEGEEENYQENQVQESDELRKDRFIVEEMVKDVKDEFENEKIKAIDEAFTERLERKGKRKR